jgi:hypothetical protein
MKQSDKKSDSFDISWIVGIALFLGFVVTVFDITIWRA